MEQHSTQSPQVVIFGSGGHAKVVIDILEEQGLGIAAVVDRQASTPTYLGYPLYGQADFFADQSLHNCEFIVAVGDNALREKLVDAIHQHISAPVFAIAIHPRSIVARSAQIGSGTAVMAGAVINSSVTIGHHCVINTGARVDHDCNIGTLASIGPGATLGGDVVIGDRSFVGINSSVIHGVNIGANSVIGAGSVVTRSVASDSVSLGNPARVVRQRSLHERFL